MDFKRQIEYWKNSAIEDLETALLLHTGCKYKESLFFCHLSIEKILKANYVKYNNEFAPKTHKLNYLASKSGIEISDDMQTLFGILMTYQLEGRYPDYSPKTPSEELIMKYIKNSKEVLECLIKRL